jgi:hypothetical protein
MGKMKNEFWSELVAYNDTLGSLKKEKVMDKYKEDTNVEQEIVVGNVVRVYGSLGSVPVIYEATVLLAKEFEGARILTVDCEQKGVHTVYDIQCRKLSKRIPRLLWLRFDKESGEYEVSAHEPEDSFGWSKFKEEV